MTIVIPVYNGAAYIKNCLQNLERQTFKDWQAIFVNDGSTDTSREILDDVAAKHEKCTVIHKPNGGTAQTRNAGLDKARGQYITFMDVDDELDPGMYECLVGLMDATHADMGICGYYFKVEQYRDGRVEEAYLEEKRYPLCVLKGQDAIRERLVDMWDQDILYNVWNKIYRMDLIREKGIRYRDGHVYTEDRVFNRAFLEQCNSIAVTDRCLYYYIRERTGSTSERYREENFSIRLKEYRELQEHFKKMDVWDEKAREYVSREFMERVAGCLENIFHGEGSLTKKEKKQAIQSIIRHPDVIEAGRYAKYRSLMMKVLTYPVSRQWLFASYHIYDMVYRIRKKDPALFHKLKSRR